MSFEIRLIEAVRRKREAEGLSLRALSGLVGVSFSSLARIERGEGAPDNNSRIRLLEWLGPDADDAGLGFENVGLVHFRAAKNVRSATVEALLRAADRLRRSEGRSAEDRPGAARSSGGDDVVVLSKEELEETARNFRQELGLDDEEALEPLLLDVEGVNVIRVTETDAIDRAVIRRLCGEACDEWSAMSVPLDADHASWAVLLNDCHSIERQRVTLLEEFWHILLGHKLTKVAKVADGYGRTYDSAEEHDAYYLASASLLPRSAIVAAVGRRETSAEVAARFGSSPELVDYRIKRLGLWKDHVGRKVALARP